MLIPTWFYTLGNYSNLKMAIASVLDDLAHVDDITDPECMDRILAYLEDIQSEDEKFIMLLISKLDDMLITWEQPWYQKKNSLTRPLADKQFEGLEIFQTDTISKKEADLIAKNWRKFIKKYKMPDKLICFARWRNKGNRHTNGEHERVRKFVTAYLARGVKRTLNQVYRHIVSHYGGEVKGKYTETEETIMKICFLHAPKQAVTILSAVLNREPRGIYKRLHSKSNGNDKFHKRSKWTLERATKFLDLLMKYSGKSLEDLKYARFEKVIWMNLQEEMGQTYISLQDFWYSSLHIQLFVKLKLKIKNLRRKIFNLLLFSPYLVWTDIRWKELLKNFPDGFTHLFLYRVVNRFISEYNYGNYRTAPLKEVANYGLQKVNTKVRHLRQRCLKTLILNGDGMLEIVKYTEKLK